MDFTDRVALVTGASMGLGRRFALDLASRGATVVGVARGADALTIVGKELTDLSPESWVRAIDVADDPSVDALIADVIERHGRVDVLINNAGIERRRAAIDLDRDCVDEIVGVNFRGTVSATLGVLPHMVERREGWIVGVTSGAARNPIPMQAPYAASKAALVAFLESISYELEPVGVRVKVLSPGFVGETRMATAAVDAGMPVPPRAVQRTPEQVSAALLKGLDAPGFEINCARLETLGPVARALVPRFYRRNIAKSQA